MGAASIPRATGPARALALAELVVVVGLLEAELWILRASGPAWLNVLIYGAIVAVAWLAHGRRHRDAAGAEVATPRVGGLRAWVEVAATCAILSATLAVAARLVGDANETFEFVFLDKPPAKLAGWAASKFAAALAQQLALQLFLWPTCSEVTRGRTSGAVLAAAIFALVHLPSPTLVAITLMAGLAWVFLYRRTGRLAPLVASHMILATLAHGALPERLTYDMRVGSTATDDLKRFEGLGDPQTRLISRRLKLNRADVKRFASPGYYDAQGGTMPGFIRGLFRDILSRDATDRDVAFWMARPMANPQADMVNIFLASDEYAAIREARKARPAGQAFRR